ncbi:MAG: hypothetical protein H6779_05485 [Candidatus Nomurabacteria bacterium]|nr:MAG: hypothetical protein H6779_05485 [Candidatus Nomurabacteria bacterium]
MKTTLQNSTYHSLLRVFSVVFAVVLVFDSGALIPATKGLSTSTQEYLANVVGVQVGVSPTEVNQLTARITELEGELEAKDREIAVNFNEPSSNGMDKSTLIISIILFILLILILLNYVLDFIRSRDRLAL